MPKLSRRGLSTASITSASNNGEGQSNFQESVMSPSLLSPTPSVANNRGTSRKGASSATTVNLSRYQSEMSWSGGSATGAVKQQQQTKESQQIKDIKVKCLQEMKEKRRQVKEDKMIDFVNHPMYVLTSLGILQLVISQRLARPSTVFTDTQLKMMVMC